MTAKVIDSVGGSIGCACSGSVTEISAMVSATVAFERAAILLASRATLRKAAGALLLAFGAWTAGSALYHLVAHGTHGGRTDHEMTSKGDPADPHAGHDR